MAARFSLLVKVTRTYFQTPNPYFRLPSTRFGSGSGSFFFIPFPFAQGSRSYSRGGHRKPRFDMFGSRKQGEKNFREEWKKKAVDEDDCLWTGSEDDSDKENDETDLDEEINNFKREASDRFDDDDDDYDSDELRSVWSGSDEEKTLWTGPEGDDDDDFPTDPYPNETSEEHIDKVFEFEDPPEFVSFGDAIRSVGREPEELSPGKQARKLAVENAFKKLKRGPDGRYINVFEVMTEVDVLIGAFENIISGPEYAELRKDGPKRLNMEFFKEAQARARDPNFKFSPVIKLKPKDKVVSRKKYERTQARRRKAQRR